MFRRTKENKAKLEHKLYLARENPEPVFDLSECDLQNVPQGIYSLCRVFLKESLRLEHNHLTSLAGGGQLSDLQLIRILNLSHNSFNHLPDDLRLLTNLEELYLNNNQLKKLPNMAALKKLKSLDVSNNSLKHLPENVGELINLRKLVISNNKLSHLPKSICNARKLFTIELDVECFVYPPTDVCQNGAAAILKFICEDTGCSFEVETEENAVEERKTVYEEDQSFQAKIWELDKIKQQKAQEFLEIEKHNEMLQRQELELAINQRARREKLLEAITMEQDRFDSELNKIQHVKEFERFKLVEQLQEAENNADLAIKQLLILNQTPIDQLLEQEKLDEERLLVAISQTYSETLRKDDILHSMQAMLTQETLKFKQFHESRLETSKSILEQELESHSRLTEVLHSQDTHKTELIAKLQQDGDLQKAAVGTLLERGDSRSWGLVQQVRLVEAQLSALTQIEINRKKLMMDQHINDLSEKRINLSMLLIDLLHQKDERTAQLLSTLQTLEAFKEVDSDYWLKQYQRLLDTLPDGLLQAQNNINPQLAQALLTNGVIHCLPFLAKLANNDFSDEDLRAAGVLHADERSRILDAFRIYEKEKQCTVLEPTAPLLIEVEEASAPLPDNITISAVECVICMDAECDVIFVPCGHLCCCGKCSLAVNECPLCRSDIERKISSIFK